MFYARALRSLRLGMGAKKRASTFDVRAVARIASTVRSVASTAPCVKRGPIAPLNSLIAATCFALREVESCSLSLRLIHLIFQLRVVSVTFGDAKTSLFLQDIKQGCSDPGKRDVPCTLASVCPFCSMARLVQAATDLHRSRGVSEEDLLDQPLFPAADGSPVGPWPWLESLRAVVACAGSRMIDATGDQVFTRLSLRRSSLRVGASVLDYLSGADAVDTTVVMALLHKKFFSFSVLPVCPDAVKMSRRPMDRWRCIDLHEPYKYFVVLGAVSGLGEASSVAHLDPPLCHGCGGVIPWREVAVCRGCYNLFHTWCKVAHLPVCPWTPRRLSRLGVASCFLVVLALTS